MFYCMYVCTYVHVLVCAAVVVVVSTCSTSVLIYNL